VAARQRRRGGKRDTDEFFTHVLFPVSSRGVAASFLMRSNAIKEDQQSPPLSPSHSFLDLHPDRLGRRRSGLVSLRAAE